MTWSPIITLRTTPVLLFGAVTSAALIIGAHLFERAGFPPCALCLDQREAHWTAMAVATAGVIANMTMGARVAAFACVGALSLVYALSAGLAFYHTGVEFNLWPGPVGCSSVGDDVVSIDRLRAGLTEQPQETSCNEAPWRLFGVSMAGYNLLASAGLFTLTFLAATVGPGAGRRSPLATPDQTGSGPSD
ncbi:MAG: disulfide bond formation protein B [Pseudomonadota bacterium]